jgi:hypothetical protein
LKKIFGITQKRPLPWWKLIRLLPKVIFLVAVTSMLFVVALVLAAFGRRSLLDNMLETFRRWHLVPPKTQDEKYSRLVESTNLSVRRLGMSWRQFIWYAILRDTWRRFMPSFLEQKTAELRDAMRPGFIPEIAKKDDIGFVLSATNMLDLYLAMAIILRFHIVLTKTSYAKVFGPRGPLGTFSAKIDLAVALGILLGDMADDLSILRKLRNDFAHAVHPPALSDAKFSQRCQRLKLTWEISEETRTACKTPERVRLAESVSMIILTLAIIIQRAITERLYMEKYGSEISAEAKAELENLRKKTLAEAQPAT